MKTLILVQARMRSSRLPNKALLWLHGLPIIDWVNLRLKTSQLANEICYILPDLPEDDVLAYHLEKNNAQVFRGSESDVLSRFYCAADQYQCDYVVRVCADNPLVSGVEIDRLIRFFEKSSCDYAYNHRPFNNLYPDGLGAEICRKSLFSELNQLATKQEHREHVFNYVWENKEKYGIETFDPENKRLHFPQLRLDIDTYEDYLKLSQSDIRVNMSCEEVVDLFYQYQIEEKRKACV